MTIVTCWSLMFIIYYIMGRTSHITVNFGFWNQEAGAVLFGSCCISITFTLALSQVPLSHFQPLASPIGRARERIRLRRRVVLPYMTTLLS